MDVGVFIPINNNGWLISEHSPQYMPSFDLNRQIVQRAEAYGLDFALSMIKLHGFGGKTGFWDHGLESFTLMAGLASVTSKIRLYASTAVLTLPPAIVARMAVTIDSISGGRFGVNIVSGWHSSEYSQMGLWPGEEYFGHRYDYSTEYVQIMRELWAEGESDFKGRFFQMDRCKLSPRPAAPIKVVSAGQSGRGMEFSAQHADYNFCLGLGMNEPAKAAPVAARMQAAAARRGRDVGSYMLFMIIAEPTDEAAWAKWDHYVAGTDHAALEWLGLKTGEDKKAEAGSTADAMVRGSSPVNLNIGTFVGSYATVARLMDEAADIPGVKGLMLTFDDFVEGLDKFGQQIQPLMRSRAHLLQAA
jgi:pyrimidine oxygenase